MTATDNRTFEVELPEHCPAWCSRNHAEYFAENVGLLSQTEVSTHYAYAGEDHLHQLSNPIDHRIEREGGGDWSLEIHQLPHPTSSGGHNGPPLIELAVRAPSRVRPNQIEMTSGDARVLAATLLAAADRIDLEGVRR